MYSFTDSNGKRFIACCECERGGNGKSENKCSCGWKCKNYNGLGCFLGSEITSQIQIEPAESKKISRSKARYQEFLSHESAMDFREWLGIKNSKYIVILEKGVFLADWKGDPGRSIYKVHAKKFNRKRDAKNAIIRARKFRKFTDAKVLRENLWEK